MKDETTMRVDDDLRAAIGRAAEAAAALRAMTGVIATRDVFAVFDRAHRAATAITDADLDLLAKVAEGGER